MHSKNMVILSLFDGMSCAQIALNKAGVKYDRYLASEIDKHAITVTQANYPNTEQLGDICKIDPYELPIIDILFAGSPCQGFSFAGKQLNFDDPRSSLFFEFERIMNVLKQRNPNLIVVFENVPMDKKSENVITKSVGVLPIMINSARVSAQNRKRLYWTNIMTEQIGLFGDLQTQIPQPKDKKILLRDILENEVDEKYILTDKAVKYMNGFARIEKYADNECNDKAGAITAGYAKGIPYNTLFKRLNSNKNYTQFDVNGKRIDHKIGSQANITKQELEARDDGKTNTLTTVQKDNIVLVREATKKGYAEIKNGECVDLRQINSKTRRGRKMDNKSNALLCQNEFMQYKNGYFRRLTPIECERLQTVPDNYTNHVSDTQRYKMLGNGWTVDVIAHILKYIRLEVDNA